MNHVVTIFQYRLLHYRVDLFDKLKTRLAGAGVELRLVHGQASLQEKARKDEGVLPWAICVENKYLTVLGRDLCWQPFLEHSKDSDLIIVMQENRILSNYFLLLRRFLFNQRIAYWGHGVNFQSRSPNGLREKWKKFFLTRVDWWFAYTDATVEIVGESGFPKEKITCLNNAIDTTEFKNEVQNISESKKLEARQSLEFSSDSRIGLFCGSLYPEKKLDFLISSCDIITRHVPEFRLVIIGDGPSASYVREQLASRPWARHLGVKRGEEKAVLFSIADVMLNPGLVGLHVLDAFSAGLPMITTINALHSPEIVYLKDRVTGRLTEDTPEAYAEAVTELLVDESLYVRTSKAAFEAADHYTLDGMVENFTQGILSFFKNFKQ